MSNNSKFRLSPMLAAVICLVAAAAFLVAIMVLSGKSDEDDMFSESYDRAEAVCLNKEIATGSSGEIYFIDIEFEAADPLTGNKVTHTVRLSETDPRLAELDQGDRIEVYFRTANPNYCHPVMFYPDYTVHYVILGILIAVCVVIAGLNIRTVIRNRNGYVPVYEKPEDIGTLGDAGADNGLSDSKIDYSAGDVFSDKLMDSYVDPFAAYTGYEENDTASQGNYYDPNASYGSYEPYQSEQSYPDPEDADLNNPFATQINNDPDNPYNSGSYPTPPAMYGDDSDYNSTEIYGDSSFGSIPDYNSTEIYGSSTFGAAPFPQQPEEK